MYSEDGFNLLELMVVLAILGVLVGLGSGQYRQHVAATHRMEGRAALLRVASELESHLFEKMRLPTLEEARKLLLDMQPKLELKYYQLSVEPPEKGFGEQYVLMARALGWQAVHDPQCSTLSVNDRGEWRASDKAGQLTQTCW